MNNDEARQILSALLAEQGIDVSPGAGAAELVHLTLSVQTLPDELCLALAETLDALAGMADDTPPETK